MSKHEHEQYKYQLSQVAAALQSDPNNPELLALQSELKDIIALTAPAKTVPQQRDPSPPPPPVPSFRPGDVVMARWVTGDGALYPARITSISGSLSNPVYTVLFLNYNNTETLRSEHVKQISESRKRAIEIENSAPSPAIPPPPKSDESTIPPPPIKKPKVKPKSELDVGKKAWQKFATKGVKNRSVGKVQKLGEKSIFKSPEDGLGRVGVTGSGKGMSKEISTRGKHIFEKKFDDD